MTNDGAVAHPNASIQDELRALGVIPCDITKGVTASAAPDGPERRLIRLTTGEELLVSAPDGLRSPCFRLSLPAQGAVARIVISDIEALAERVGHGSPAKGIGLAANQSASLAPRIRELAREKADEAPLLSDAQRKASLGDGSVPAYFRYEDPHGNVIRMFNPVDATPRDPDGSYATETDVRGEGCLSSILFRGQMVRPVMMNVDGEDLEGQVFRVTARGPAARLLGHEVSHVTGGIDGLCIIEGGLPVIPLDEWDKLEPKIRDWQYHIDFTATPYLELSDPAGRLDSSHLSARLRDQGLFTPTAGDRR